MTMEVAGPVCGIVQLLWLPLSQQNDYLKNFKDNVKILKRKMDELTSRANSVKREVIRAEQERKMVTYETEVWLQNVGGINKEMSDIEQILMGNYRGCRGFLLGCNLRRRISRRSLKLTLQVTELMEKSPFVGGVSVDQLPSVGLILPTITLVGETAKITLEQIWKWVTDKDIGKFGVHGMGGVGKTAILKHINNRLKESELFDSIIWVTMSKAFDLESLQTDIAEAIGLDLSKDKHIERRSAKLFAALTCRKNNVLILDDMWEAFPLEKIGIPQPSKDNGCKLVLTTRSVEVCRGMETQIDIKVNLLSDEEAWILFKDKVGGDPVISSNIQSVAKLVAKKCGRLPLAIVTVGRALRQVDDVRVWRHTLSELEGSTNEVKDMKKDVFVPLRFSYDRLKSKMIQSCFLCCALFSEGYKIPANRLIEYWIGEGLIDEVGNRQAEVDKGYFILNELKNAYMLESINSMLNEECVRMHDLIRDMAIHIMRESHLFMSRAGIGLEHSPKEEEWLEDAERISLMENKIEVLSCEPNCPKVSVLLLQGNPLLQITQHSFFQNMHNLKVLDLSRTLVDSLPDSISDLVNLHALFLCSCRRLKNVPSLEKLKELRILDMSHTPIDKLPQGIEGLLKLRCLDLSYTENLKMFPAGLIAKLSLLEDLSTYRSSWLWLSIIEEMDGGAGIEEIISSTRLANLRLSFWDLATFENYVRSGHCQILKTFNFMIGWKSALWYSKYNCSIEIVSEGLLSRGSSLVLPTNTLRLHIENCHDIIQFSELSCLSNLSDLREFSVYTCKGIDCLVTAKGNPLSSIEILNLWNLPNLRSLCNQIVPPSSFISLKVLQVEWCDKLKSLFSLGLLQHLQKLEQVRVVKSDAMERIVGEDMDEATRNSIISTVTLPSLKRLDLKYLPELNSIYAGELICNVLTAITVEKCPKLRRLPISIDAVPALEVIKGEKKWLDELEWDDPNCSTFFQHSFKEW